MSEPKLPPHAAATGSSPLARLRPDQQLRALIDTMPDFIYIKDLESRFVLANEAVAKRMGAAHSSEVLGKTDFDFYAEERAGKYHADDQEVVASGKPLIGHEEFALFADGTECWLSSTKTPLRDEQGEIIGVIGIGREITQRKQAEDRAWAKAEELRRRNEGLEQDLKLAQEFQNAMLPPRSLRCVHDTSAGTTAVELEHRFLPQALVCGDFLAIRRFSEGRVGILLCDAIGHGVRAALIAAILEGILEKVSMACVEPAETLAFFNTRLREAFRRQEAGLFVTALYVIVDLAAQELRYARAGHHEPIRLNGASGKIEALPKAAPGPALGLLPDPSFAAASCPLRAEDVFVFCTDGLLEARAAGEEEYGDRRLAAFLEQADRSSLPALCDDLIADARTFSSARAFLDDVSIVVMSCVALGQETP